MKLLGVKEPRWRDLSLVERLRIVENYRRSYEAFVVSKLNVSNADVVYTPPPRLWREVLTRNEWQAALKKPLPRSTPKLLPVSTLRRDDRAEFQMVRIAPQVLRTDVERHMLLSGVAACASLLLGVAIFVIWSCL